MPKAMHEALERSADKKGLTGSRRGAYVYGTLAKKSKKNGKREGQRAALRGM